MSGDSSSDDGQGEECLENDCFSTAGEKDKRVVVVNGMSLLRCRRGGLCRKGFGECGLYERCTCVCAGGTRVHAQTFLVCANLGFFARPFHTRR